MVPFQTFLALIALLVLASSCTQLEPPHPGDQAAAAAAAQAQSALNQRTVSDSNVVVTPSSASVDMSTPGIAKINLIGGDAQTLFNFLAIQSEQVGGSSTLLAKQGAQFSCVEDSGNYSCGFAVSLSNGLIPEMLPANAVEKGTPLLSLAALKVEQESAGYFLMELPASKSPNKIRVFFGSDVAGPVYEAMNISSAPGPAFTGYSNVTQKDTDALTCMKEIVNSTGKLAYFCDLYLDVSVGAIDKPSDDSSLY